MAMAIMVSYSRSSRTVIHVFNAEGTSSVEDANGDEGEEEDAGIQLTRANLRLGLDLKTEQSKL